ncbi:hypothetical protein HGB07_06515, partial [Candidatus Roizmanbacteria bacterium]|nr:hypothetical protein [Candidatus Roizmanbacteria bacterium]
GTTTAKWEEYRTHYFNIRNHLKELGCIILDDWIDTADFEYKNKVKNRNISEIFKNVTEAIDTVDGVVIEYTVPNFSSSHQINYALIRRKPTLVMRLQKDNPYYTDSYLEAVQSPYLIIREYTKNNYKQIIEEYINYSKLEQGQSRYNIVLAKRQKQYLDWAASKFKNSRSEIIRKLLDQEIEKCEDYKRYMHIK